jgi:hypothetical protein
MSRWRELAAGDRGQATVEVAVFFAGLIVFLLLVVQLALWSVARSLASAAAEEGVRAGRAEGAGLLTGQQAARGFLDQTVGHFLLDTAVTSSGSSPTEIRIQVAGHSLSVIPGTFSVREQARGPIERFTLPGQS